MIDKISNRREVLEDKLWKELIMWKNKDKEKKREKVQKAFRMFNISLMGLRK